MEIAVVAGFAAFLGKYLEQQFNLTTSSANQLLGRQIVTVQAEQQIFLSLLSKMPVETVGQHWTLLSFLPRDDSHPLCLSRYFPRGAAGEEAEPVSFGRRPHGHAGQPGVHCLLRLFPLLGL